MIVLHIGGNDVHNGRTPDQVLEDFKAFVGKVPRRNRTCRWRSPASPRARPVAGGRCPTRRQPLIKEYVATQKGLSFIDLWDAMLSVRTASREKTSGSRTVSIPTTTGYLIRVRIMRPLLGPPDKP